MVTRASMILALTALAGSAQTLDRIAVTVGNQVITESDILLGLRVTAFVDRRPVDLSASAKHEEAERLVNRALILQEAANYRVPLPGTEAAVGMISGVKAGFANEEQFKAELARYQIRESDLAASLLAVQRSLTFTDLRFRPEVQISEEELRALYAKQTPAPGKTSSFEEERPRLEKDLTEQGVTEALDKWLAMARSETRIQYHDKAFE